MAFLTTEDTTLMNKNMMDNHLGWTSIFGTSSGGNTVGSFEASINQPEPDSPEPFPLTLIIQMEGSIIAALAVVEERIEDALVHDGFNVKATILVKGHQEVNLGSKGQGFSSKEMSELHQASWLETKLNKTGKESWVADPRGTNESFKGIGLKQIIRYE
ncbi:hypothetical protein TanjilG_25734 [Lupinus angustifolius]|uniref:Uncharacterized protein n=1 Tax=Lupinus angustifolius TaxID=3871 RepID=A0A394DLE7_LUPAN|nr:hypothetical protein TanjilG_25734 [Lupinus angustifolius]